MHDDGIWARHCIHLLVWKWCNYHSSPSPTGCGKIAIMAKPAVQFEVACPCCGALLKIDAEAKAVIAHTPKAVPKTFEEAVRKAKETPDTGKPLRDFDLD